MKILKTLAVLFVLLALTVGAVAEEFTPFGIGEVEEKTQKEVADMLGISQSYISRLEKKIIVRLKKEFSKMV